MNQEEKAKRYDWLLEQYKLVEREINKIPKLPLETTLHDVNNREYTLENERKVNFLKYESIQIPVSFIIGISFISGSILGSLLPLELKKRVEE